MQILQSPDFYPRSPCGERRILGGRLWHGEQFLSTLSLRRATEQTARKQAITAISIHALLAESDKNSGIALHDLVISIHALLAESDNVCGGVYLCIAYFYPRSPCGERPYILPLPGTSYSNFYPRSPCGERPSRLHKILADWDFYPRSPCGERPWFFTRIA